MANPRPEKADIRLERANLWPDRADFGWFWLNSELQELIQGLFQACGSSLQVGIWAYFFFSIFQMDLTYELEKNITCYHISHIHSLFSYTGVIPESIGRIGTRRN